MVIDRYLDWEGCFNVRDLGGIRTVGGGETHRGSIVRADSLDRLTPAGWEALYAHGVRTVVDLRNPEERPPAHRCRPGGVTTVHVPIDDTADKEFWQYLWDESLDGSPLYYRPFLERKPERCTAALTAVARARPGGVVVHCGVGRDRTGLLAMLLLALADVAPDDIAADYELSIDRVPAIYAATGRQDDGPETGRTRTPWHHGPRCAARHARRSGC